MKYKIKLLVMATMLFGSVFAQVAMADNVLKTLYIDGNMVGQVPADACEGLTWPSTILTIGTEGGGYMYNQYVGKIDEFTVYSGVLSSGRVAAHYAARSTLNAYSSAVAADLPKLWLKFNDASTLNGATALNSGGATGKNGTYNSTVSGGSINKVAGFVPESNAVELVGKDNSGGTGNNITVPDSAGDFSTLTNGDVSIELWVNFADANDYPRFFQHNGSWTALGGYAFAISGPNDPNQGVVVGGGVSNYIILPYYINDSNWHHIVVTYDSTYIPLVTGTYQSEVMADNPALYLKFDTLPLVDSSGHHNWVTKNDPPRVEFTVGAEGNAIYMNGGWVIAANQLTDPCHNPSSYDNQFAFAPDSITFEFWLKDPAPDSVDTYASFFSQCSFDSNDSAFPSVYSPRATRSAADCTIFFGDGRNGGLGSGGAAWCNGAYKNTDPNWHHYVVEYNVMPEVNSVNLKWYTDGINYKNSTYGPGVSRGYVGPEQDHILIGNKGDRYTAGGNPYRQYMDEFAIYPGLLSPGRIAAHYAAWRARNCAEWTKRGFPVPSADINRDCVVNFLDFAELALDWAKCNDPYIGAPRCPPNW